MPDRQQIQIPSPSCPLCMSETEVKQVHREPHRDVVVYKCRSCAVEYPVVGGTLAR